MHQFNPDEYKKLLETFIENGYQFEKYNMSISRKGVVVLRHDVDFCLKYALDIAKLDEGIGIKSTFFFMVDNILYNPFEKGNAVILKQISDMGHSICLHIDEQTVSCKSDFYQLMNCAKSYFPFLDTTVISRHRPNLLQPVRWLPDDILDTYCPTFFDEIEYASDSRGEWKYGYPTQREAFFRGISYQLLLHPIWWALWGKNGDKIERMISEREMAGVKSISYLNI